MRIGEFFGCMLQADCIFSIKKFLVYVFSVLTIYVAIFTDREIYELLAFVAVLLGIRSYDKVQRMKMNKPSDNLG